jgi:hypothetical protein
VLASSRHRAIKPPSRQSIEPASSLHRGCIEAASSLHRATASSQHRAFSIEHRGRGSGGAMSSATTPHSAGWTHLPTNPTGISRFPRASTTMRLRLRPHGPLRGRRAAGQTHRQASCTCIIVPAGAGGSPALELATTRPTRCCFSARYSAAAAMRRSRLAETERCGAARPRTLASLRVLTSSLDVTSSRALDTLDTLDTLDSVTSH